MKIKEFKVDDPQYTTVSIHYFDSLYQSDSPLETIPLKDISKSKYAEYTVASVREGEPGEVRLAIKRMKRYTPFEQLILEQLFNDTIEVIELSTGKQGVANSIPFKDHVQVFYGSDDGSDDKTISADEFNWDFDITNVC